jgi:hypothetical protein
MAANTNFLGSGLTQQFTGSDASFAGNVVIAGTLDVTGAQTFTGALTGSSLSLTGRVSAASVVAGGGAFTVSTATVAVVAMSVTGNKSVTTTAAFSGATTTNATTNPVVYIATPSGMSADVVLTVLPSSKDVVTLYYSNVSSVTAAVAANTVRITQIKF